MGYQWLITTKFEPCVNVCFTLRLFFGDGNEENFYVHGRSPSPGPPLVPWALPLNVRKAREAYLIERGKTLEPLGINKKNER